LFGWATPVANASFARSSGGAISAYSASLFGKTGLSSRQVQTLTADPNEPLGGSTSVIYDIETVDVTDYGFGPGYLRGDDSPFGTGFGIEVIDPASPNGRALIDLADYLELPGSHTPTGYLRVYFKISGEGPMSTGKLTNDPVFNGFHPGYTQLDTDGPLGVDTHYYDFEYKTTDNSNSATYTVYADTNTRYAFTPTGAATYTPLDTDYVITQDMPGVQIHPGGDVPFEGAQVSGTIPEPTATALLAAVLGLRGLATRSRHRRS
jgi:hypothetical protein